MSFIGHMAQHNSPALLAGLVLNQLCLSEQSASLCGAKSASLCDSMHATRPMLAVPGVLYHACYSVSIHPILRVEWECVSYREFQQQQVALQAAQAEMWAERSQLSLEQQATAGDRARAVHHAQEAASEHTRLLAQLKQAQMQSLLVRGAGAFASADTGSHKPKPQSELQCACEHVDTAFWTSVHDNLPCQTLTCSTEFPYTHRIPQILLLFCNSCKQDLMLPAQFTQDHC